MKEEHIESETNKDSPSSSINTFSVLGQLIALFGIVLGVTMFSLAEVTETKNYFGEIEKHTDPTWIVAGAFTILFSLFWWSLILVLKAYFEKTLLSDN